MFSGMGKCLVLCGRRLTLDVLRLNSHSANSFALVLPERQLPAFKVVPEINLAQRLATPVKVRRTRKVVRRRLLELHRLLELSRFIDLQPPPLLCVVKRTEHTSRPRRHWEAFRLHPPEARRSAHSLRDQRPTRCGRRVSGCSSVYHNSTSFVVRAAAYLCVGPQENKLKQPFTQSSRSRLLRRRSKASCRL